ncbi:hypothetical protein DPMN_026128 [Dreissena polymorpha]|uniref:Uncharacterized protein n=1 Tax=Dreissena polymorpha TaxID=45954 RepID=A0A9D4LSU5_DREPO|nr:hypothetical protein DPMN_026128 [Dreissena polymorpha]
MSFDPTKGLACVEKQHTLLPDSKKSSSDMSFQSSVTPEPMISRLEFRLGQAPESVGLARVLNAV